ncbi:MAG: hypothetical protein ACRDPS_01140 [Nocardioides sp.]|uniref:hypothetical protein n=1 Tax=Nocardioides sp. TaxID=35761 RepID=UPI003D6BEB45
MNPRPLAAAAAAGVLLLTGGCGEDVNKDAIPELEQQREDVLAWAGTLSKTAEDVLDTAPENAIETYDGAARTGASDEFTSFHYVLQADFSTATADPLSVLSGELSEFDPKISGQTLTLAKGDLTASFRAYPQARGKVGLEAAGPAVEIEESRMSEWDGWVIGEPVDLG